jgi:hypothetical protein
MKLAFINNLINILTGGNNLNEEALGTAKIINFFAKLFDSVNGGTVRLRCGKLFSGGVYKNSGHIKFWKEAMQHLSNMHFIDKTGKKLVPPTFKNWITTLQGFLDLYEILVEGGKCKSESRCN